MSNKRSMVSASIMATLVLCTISANALAQTYKVIYTFTGMTDGANPWEGVTIDSAGNFYGTTNGGGAPGINYGTVYKLSHKPTGWALSTLHSFVGASDGAGSYAGVSFGANGSLYGSTGTGGGGPCMLQPVQKGPGCGTIFKLTNTKSGWKERVLYSFQGPPTDGAEPIGPLAFDAAGNIYGATAFGGSTPGCFDNCGVVFELTKSGHGYTESILHNFGTGNDGGAAYGGLVMDKTGNLYGTTLLTGNNPGNPLAPTGTVYQLVPTPTGWTENVLYSFQNGADGANPQACLILDQSGNLYGASSNGGQNGGGVAFELSPSGGAWVFTGLYDFVKTGNSIPYQCTNCIGPVRQFVMDSAGNLYGTAFATGAYGYGSVFKLSPSGGTWTYTTLHDFTGGTDGAYPQSKLVFDSKGHLWGTTTYGGAGFAQAGFGVIFEVVQ